MARKRIQEFRTLEINLCSAQHFLKGWFIIKTKAIKITSEHRKRKLGQGRKANLSKKKKKKKEKWLNTTAVTEHRARLLALEATAKQASGDVT